MSFDVKRLRYVVCGVFFFQAEDGIRYLVRSRGLGDVYKRQIRELGNYWQLFWELCLSCPVPYAEEGPLRTETIICLLYTSDAADERSSVDLGGRRIIKKKNNDRRRGCSSSDYRVSGDIQALTVKIRSLR